MKYTIGNMDEAEIIKNYKIKKENNGEKLIIKMVNWNKTSFYCRNEDELDKYINEKETEIQKRMIEQERLRAKIFYLEDEICTEINLVFPFAVFAYEVLYLSVTGAGIAISVITDSDLAKFITVSVSELGLVISISAIIELIRDHAATKEIKKSLEFLNTLNLKMFSDKGTISFDRENNPRLFDGVNYKGKLNVNTYRKYALSALRQIRENASNLEDNSFVKKHV